MAGLHVHLRTLTLAASLAAVLVAAGCRCSDRVAGDEPEGYGEPACMWLINPVAVLADGSMQLILDREHDRSPTVCVCLTQAEYDSLGDRLERVGFPEQGTLLEEYNELAYDECKRLSGLIEGVVDDECLDYYQDGRWLKDIDWATGADANAKPPGFTCLDP